MSIALKFSRPIAKSLPRYVLHIYHLSMILMVMTMMMTMTTMTVCFSSSLNHCLFCRSKNISFKTNQVILFVRGWPIVSAESHLNYKSFCTLWMIASFKKIYVLGPLFFVPVLFFIILSYFSSMTDLCYCYSNFPGNKVLTKLQIQQHRRHQRCPFLRW